MLEFIKLLIGLKTAAKQLVAGLFILSGLLGSGLISMYFQKEAQDDAADRKLEMVIASKDSTFNYERGQKEFYREQVSVVKLEARQKELESVTKLYEEQKSFNAGIRKQAAQEREQQSGLARKNKNYINEIKYSAEQLRQVLEQKK